MRAFKSVGGGPIVFDKVKDLPCYREGDQVRLDDQVLRQSGAEGGDTADVVMLALPARCNATPPEHDVGDEKVNNTSRTTTSSR